MKRILFTTLLALMVSGLLAQSAEVKAVEKAKTLLMADKLTEAKTEIDKLLTKESNQKNPYAWYIKAQIYNAIAMDATTKDQYPTARKEAFEALKKYSEDDKWLFAIQIDAYKPVLEVYNGYFQEASAAFESKNYEQSYENYENAIEVSTFMIQKRWINLKLDTTAIFNTGLSAERLNKPDDAAIYYLQLVEARAKREGFAQMYRWVANYYYEKKDFANASKFLSLGKQVYPDDPFWANLELAIARDKDAKN